MASTRQKTLSRVVLTGVGVRIALIVLVTTLVGHYFAASNFEASALKTLTQYVDECSARESQQLMLAEQNLKALREHYLELLKTFPQSALAERFDTLVLRRSDGALQSDLNVPPNLRRCTIFVPRGAELNQEIKARITILHDLCGIYGPAWREQFPGGIYFETYQSVNVEYHGTLPAWSTNAPATWDLTQRKEFVVSIPQANPARNVAFTAPFYSNYMKAMMVDAVIPIDEDGRHVATGGLNIRVDRLLQRTRTGAIENGYNLLLRADGLLISGPTTPEHVPAGNVKEMNDSHLKAIYQCAISIASNADSGVKVQRVNDDYIGVTRLAGPGWYFVSVLPRAAVLAPATSFAHIGLLIGAACILLEILLLSQFLRKKVTKPLEELTRAAAQVEQNNMAVHFSPQSTHELERLTEAFVAMARGVAERDARLAAHARQLEETVQQRTEEVQRVHYEQLVQATKLNSLGLLVAGVAHEINNPNHSIQGNAHLLARVWKDAHSILQSYYERNGDFELGGIPYSELNRAAPELFDAISSCSRRIQLFIEELKRYARKDTATTESVDLNRVLSGSVMLLKSNIKSKCELTVDQAPGLPPVSGRFAKLEQVIVNLVQNAVESFPDERPVSQRKISLSSKIQAGGVEICVADNGGGISPEDQKHLTEPFFTRRQARGGTGLGLYVTAAIVKEHGGVMTFESQIDAGTTVRIWLPARSSPALEAELQETKAATA